MFNFFGYHIKKSDLLQVTVDLLIILIGFYLYYYFGLASKGATTPDEVSPIILVIITSLITWSILFALDAYHFGRYHLLGRLFSRLGAAFIITSPLSVFIWWLAGFEYLNAVLVPVAAIFIQMVLFFITRLFFCLLPEEFFQEKIIIIGSDDENKQINKILNLSNTIYKIEDIISYQDLKNYKRTELAGYCSKNSISMIIIGHKKDIDHLKIFAPCCFLNVSILDINLLSEQYLGKVNAKKLYSYHLLFDKYFSLSPLGGFIKRLFDILVAVLILIISLPITIPVSILIYLQDRKNILYKQARVGLGGEEFSCFKFRSMIIDAEKDGKAIWAKQEDNRITPIGKFIRKTRIDEIPQCINVLMGDMSVVGPRPERPEFVEILSEKIHGYDERHYLKPGITGWAQINERYGASIEDARRKLEYDLYYIKHSSIILDVLILLKTIAVIIWPYGVR